MVLPFYDPAGSNVKRLRCAMIESRYEDRPCNASAGVHRRCGSIQALRRHNECAPLRSAFNACTPRTGLSKEVSPESEPARAEAKAQAFRFPRPCLEWKDWR